MSHFKNHLEASLEGFFVWLPQLEALRQKAGISGVEVDPDAAAGDIELIGAGGLGDTVSPESSAIIVE